MDVIENSFVSRVQTEIRLVDVFEKTLADWEMEADVPPMQFYFGREPFNHPHYLSPALRSNFHKDIKKFIETSGSKFLPVELREDRNWRPRTARD